MKLPLEITLSFTNLVQERHYLIITGDQEAAWVRIRNKDDDDYSERSVMLDPQEIDVVVSSLLLFKHRLLNPKKERDYEE
jgi:hypothetical protein